MFSNFFIERPIFAWVLALMITLGGVIAIRSLGIESYPPIAPPQVAVVANYPGADAETVEHSVTQVIEQQLSGVDHLMYFSSNSNANGSATINLTFEPGTNPDIAAMQTQNKVTQASPRLPTEVNQQGVVVVKQNPDFLMFVSLRSEDGKLDSKALDNLVATSVVDQIGRVQGVGSIFRLGSEYAMRIWLDADKLHGYGMSAAQALSAVRAQNVQVAAGSIGAEPAIKDTAFTATVTAEGRFNKPEEFENIILRADASGTTVRLKDVARVQLGPGSYGQRVVYNGQAVSGFGVQLVSGANALDVAVAVKEKMAELQPNFPPGVGWFVPYDTTQFIKISIEEVVKTLAEAVVLVFLVMLLFLQNFRATIIATLVIPVALMGGFLGMWVVGFTINQLSLFGMVLAIGIVVDDAIVVIENVERIMSEEKLNAADATRKAMKQIQAPVVAIAVVLMAVFIPSALQSGSVGAIYRQFALTIALSTAFSAMLALVFTPALCATIIKPHNGQHNAFFRWFNRTFDWARNTYTGHIRGAVRMVPMWMVLFGIVAIACYVGVSGVPYTGFNGLPKSFVPEEDQGYGLAIVGLPAGASITRTNEVMDQVSKIIRSNEEVEGVFAISGFSFVGSAENVGMAFIRFKPWDERHATAMMLIQKIQGELFVGVKDAMAFVINLPTIRGLGQFGGFDMYLQDRTGLGHDALAMAAGMAFAKAGERPDVLAGVRPNVLPDTPQLKLSVDRVQAQSMGMSLSDVYTAIQLMLAPVYVNDFVNNGRVQRVTMQADSAFRANSESLSRFFVPSSKTPAGSDTPLMIPISNVVQSQWKVGPPTLVRYNGYEAVEIVGSPAPGRSSGDAMAAMTDIIKKDLPQGYGFDWTGQSLQEILAGNQAPMLLALSIFVVFLCLAALYESWSIPVAVMLVIPLGITGMVAAIWLRHSFDPYMANDVYFMVGLLTIVGLAAKNAILIVEFAVEEQRAGRPLATAVVDAARLRLRPILMTSFAFILGVLPLAISSGAGANARHAIGTGVIGGMLFATFLGVLFIPIFFVFVRRVLGDKLEPAEETLRNTLNPSKHE